MFNKPDTESHAIFHQLQQSLTQKGVILVADPKFGAISPELIGMEAKDTKGDPLGFLQIIFEGDGWRILTEQTEKGKSLIHKVAESVEQDSDDLEIEDLTISMPMHVAFLKRE